MYHIDAFTRRVFGGNPAAVVPIGGPFPDAELMQHIAAENNLSETAFFTSDSPNLNGADYELRWFTPTMEVDLCGHATLASAHVLFEHLDYNKQSIAFASRSGRLEVSKADEGMLTLNFPVMECTPIPVSNDIVRALGPTPSEVYDGSKLMVVFDNKREVHELQPDFNAIKQLGKNVIVTAPGVGHDFVSRFFAPMSGVNEDPVTGSAHCMLTPYWSKRLSKQSLTAHQVSRRGGELACEMLDGGKRIGISGYAVTYMQGTIHIPVETPALASV